MEILSKKNLLAGLLLLVVLVGGTMGFLLVEDGWTVMDAFYMTVISLTTVGYGEVHPLSSAGRIVAMVVLFCGLGVVGWAIAQITGFVVSGELSGVFERNRIRKLVATLRGHAIVCGLGARGSSIAGKISAASSGLPLTNLTAVEISGEMDTVADLRRTGSMVFTGNARDLGTLQSAGLQTAGQVVIVAGSDHNNLAIARDVSEFCSQKGLNPRILAAVEQYETRSYFADRVGNLGITVMGFREQAALKIVQRLTLEVVGRLQELPQRPLRIFVEASEALRDEILRALVMLAQITAAEHQEIFVFGAGEECGQRFRESFPALDSCARIVWQTGGMESGTKPGQEPDMAVFATQPDTQSLYLAERFLMRHPGIPPAQVIACIQDTGDLLQLARQPDPHKRQPTVMSLYESQDADSDPLSPAMDAEGRAIHERYREAAMKENRDPGAWENLSEFLRNSNLHAALHQPIKRRLYDTLCANGVSEEEVLYHLTVTEHQRWMAFHVMNGWQSSPEEINDRSLRNQLKRHHCITGFNNLDPATKFADLRNVLQALEIPGERIVAGINA